MKDVDKSFFFIFIIIYINMISINRVFKSFYIRWIIMICLYAIAISIKGVITVSTYPCSFQQGFCQYTCLMGIIRGTRILGILCLLRIFCYWYG